MGVDPCLKSCPAQVLPQCPVAQSSLSLGKTTTCCTLYNPPSLVALDPSQVPSSSYPVQDMPLFQEREVNPDCLPRSKSAQSHALDPQVQVAQVLPHGGCTQRVPFLLRFVFSPWRVLWPHPEQGSVPCCKQIHTPHRKFFCFGMLTPSMLRFAVRS